MNYFVGIHIGMTEVAIGAFDATGGRVAFASAKVASPKEEEAGSTLPEDWWTATQEGWSSLRRQGLDVSQIGAVGLSGQASLVFLDEFGGSARPAIPFGEKLFGAPTQATHESLAANIRWVMTREPDVAQRVHWVCLAKDYVGMQLCGEVCSDGPSFTGVVHPLTHDADAEVLAQLGLRPTQLPRWTRPFRNSGYSTKETQELLGLPIGVPIVAGCGEDVCRLLGTGIYDPGIVGCSCGEPAVVGYCRSDVPKTSSDRIVRFARSRVFVLTCDVDGPTAVARACELLRVEPDDLPALLGQWRPGARSPMYVRDPARASAYADGHSRLDAIVNVRADASADDLACAVFEGAGHALCERIDATKHDTGDEVTTVHVSGEGPLLDTWAQTLSDGSGLAVRVSAETCPAALGAAMLAAVGYGEFEAVADAVSAMSRLGPPRTPRSDVHDEVYARREQYRRFSKRVANYVAKADSPAQNGSDT